MVFISGTQRTEKKLGYVADFCPVCHGFQSFRLSKIGSGDHLYFIPLGTNQVLGHIATCLKCGTVLEADPLVFRAFAKKVPNQVESLIDETFPDIRRVRAARLELESKTVARTLDASERQMLIGELFRHFETRVVARTKGVQIQGRGGWGCLGTVLLGALLLVAVNLLSTDSDKRAMVFPALGAIALVGGLISFILMLLEPGRIMKREILPALAAALHPVKASEEELETVLTRLRQSGFLIGKKVKLTRLMAAMNPMPSPEGFHIRP